jgi:hypothetical protein
MSPKVLISLCLNVGLGALYFFITRTGAENPAVEAKKGAVITQTNKATEPRPVMVTNVVQTEFKWAQLESEDYKEYIARLRAVGCPEATIRDIILADLDNVYEPKLNKLRGINPVAVTEPYWLVGRAKNPFPRPGPEAQKEITALGEERTALVKELLGVSEKAIRSEFNWYDDAAQSKYSFLTPEQAEKLMSLEKKIEQLRAASGKSRPTGDSALFERDPIREQMHQEMAAIMSPQEILDYEMRTSEEAQFLRYHTRSIDLKEGEFREFFRHFYGFLETERTLSEEDRKNPEKKAELKRQEKDAEKAMIDILGKERFEEVERFGTTSYRNLVVAAPFLGYDKAAALQAHNMKQEAMKASQALIKNPALTPEARDRALQEIRQTTEKAISGVIGERGLKYYQRKGGLSLPEAPRPEQPTP